MVNAASNLTSTKGILTAIAKTIIAKDMKGLIDTIKSYKSKGYFSSKVQGIYADSVEAAATLATVMGAWIKSGDTSLMGYGGAGGYYHFHNLSRTIHIWYGDRIK